jgi:preprotein translocase subunit YajC
MDDALIESLAWAAQTAAPDGPRQGLTPGTFLFLVSALILLFWVVFLRPQKADERKRREYLDSVAKGDAIVTTGGIIGTVESVDAAKGVVTVAVAPKVSLKFSRAAIASITSRKGKGGNDTEQKT